VSGLNQILTEVIRAGLTSRNMTVDQLEQKAKLTAGTLNSYLDNGEDLDMTEMLDVFSVLGIDAIEFVANVRNVVVPEE